VKGKVRSEKGEGKRENKVKREKRKGEGRSEKGKVKREKTV